MFVTSHLPLLDLLPRNLFLLFFRRPRPQLKRMYPPRPLQLLLQQSVHHPMPRRLHLRLERFGRDEHTEMRLLGYAALHGLVVGVHAGVVVNFEGGGL